MNAPRSNCHVPVGATSYRALACIQPEDLTVLRTEYCDTWIEVFLISIGIQL